MSDLRPITYPTFCLHRAQCQHLVGAGKCVRGKGEEWNLNGWTPKLHLPPRPAVSLGFPSLDVHQMISKRDCILMMISAQKAFPITVYTFSFKNTSFYTAPSTK